MNVMSSAYVNYLQISSSKGLIEIVFKYQSPTTPYHNFCSEPQNTGPIWHKIATSSN